MCDFNKLDKWCQPQFLLVNDSSCKAYCPSGNPDPKNQFCCDEIENAIKCENNQTKICERLKLEKIYSQSMQRDIPFFVVLPTKWDPAKNDTFPVVTVFHGNDNTFARFAFGNLNYSCYNDDFLLVFPDGDVNTYYVDSPIDPRIRYETFMITELRPFLIQNYRARNDRKWANVGLSSGGFASLALAIKHRDKYCVAHGFSPVIIVADVGPWNDNLQKYRFGNKESEKDHYLPFNLTWIAENTTLQNNQLNIFITSYKDDRIRSWKRYQRIS